jgi:hypothetical protein
MSFFVAITLSILPFLFETSAIYSPVAEWISKIRFDHFLASTQSFFVIIPA